MCDNEKNTPFAGVVLDEAVEIVLDYSIPKELLGKVFIGSRVIVPVKTSLRKGTVWALRANSHYPILKEIHELASEQSVLTKDLILLAQWIASYYSSPMHKVLKAILPSSIRNHMKEQNQWIVEKIKPLEILSTPFLDLQKSFPKHANFLMMLLELGGKAPLSKLLEKANASKSSILLLEKKHLISLKTDQVDRSPSWDDDYFISKAKPLSIEQDEAVQKIKQDLLTQSFASHL